MYYCDKNGLVWKQEGEVYRNVGLSVTEKAVTFKKKAKIPEIVTFKKIATVKVVPSSVVISHIPDAVPVTIREAVAKLGVSELTPLEPLKNLMDKEV